MLKADPTMPTPALPPLAPGCRCALLRHDLPDGTSHIDWLIEPAQTANVHRDDPERRDVLTFRVDGRPDTLQVGQTIRAERIADHRRMYLTYEGPVPGDRGQVARVRAGHVLACETRADGTTILTIHWQDQDAQQCLMLVPDPRGRERHDPGSRRTLCCVWHAGAAE